MSHKEANHHNVVAKMAPAVPGAIGQKPLPKPVPIIVGIKGVSFISDYKFTEKTLRKS